MTYDVSQFQSSEPMKHRHGHIDTTNVQNVGHQHIY
jgi:hypothetical protein